MIAIISARSLTLLISALGWTARGQPQAGCESIMTVLSFFTARRVCIARTMPWQDFCLSVRLSVRPSHAGILCKRLYISSKFFYRRVAPAF